ncbi:acyloxyacyl hydrolase [Halomonas nitroreducens]|uniref:Acyloxyacyl hydrolase n=1 Tax=Halomonas nitroreducens TaxID=447425 RepID=A0A3S0JBT1_9GAMM|nr:acyloxyacyl hydrolase [Halomonas nitroreducens]RTR05704.1 acyloxyacyl hydrolase [Halomonas nitroreducens]
MTRLLPRCTTVTVLAACLGSPPAGAAPSLELGATSEGTPTLGVNLDWMHDLSHWHPALDLRLATGLLLLPGENGEDNAAWKLNPALRYHLNGGRAFLEAGLGGGLFMETEVGDQALSTAFQFESRLAVGMHFAYGGELGASAAHYSNARMDLPNEGFEVYALVYRQPL